MIVRCLIVACLFLACCLFVSDVVVVAACVLLSLLLCSVLGFLVDCVFVRVGRRIAYLLLGGFLCVVSFFEFVGTLCACLLLAFGSLVS